ncbi:MAG: DHHA1 domain-containing protein, partial [Planctomycetia bacterium]
AELPKRIEALQKEVRDLQKQLKEKPAVGAADQFAEIMKTAATVGAGTIFIATIAGAPSQDDLRTLADKVRAQTPASAVLLASQEPDKVQLLAMVDDGLAKRLNAGKWLQEAAAKVDGKGGGRPTMAQGGGKNPAALPDALAAARAFAEAALTG